MAGNYNRYSYSYNVSSVYFFSADIYTMQIKEGFWYTAPVGMYFLTLSRSMGLSVISGIPTLYTFIRRSTDDTPDLLFMTVKLNDQSVYVYKNVSRVGGCEKVLYDYSDGTLWCVDSFAVTNFNISTDNITSTTYSIFTGGFMTSRSYAAMYDMENRIFYTLASAAGLADGWYIYDIDSNQKQILNGTILCLTLWNLELVGEPAPCYGCVHGTCNTKKNTCQCDDGWNGAHCENKDNTPPPSPPSFPQEQDISTITQTSVYFAFLAPIISAIALKFSGLQAHFAFKTAVIHAQMLMLPLQVNKPLFEKIQSLFKYMGLFTLTPPFTLDLTNTKEVYMNYGNYLFPKIAVVVVVILLLTLLSRPANSVKGIRLFGISIILSRGLRTKLLLVIVLPILFSILAVALNIQSTEYGYIFSTCYIIWNILMIFVGLYLFYTRWFLPRAEIYYSFGPSPQTRVSFGRKKKEAPETRKFGLLVTSETGGKILCFPKIYIEPLKSEEIFDNEYGPLFNSYKVVQIQENGGKLNWLRSKINHKFEFVNIVHTFSFTILTVLLWRTWVGIIINVLQQVIIILVIIVLKPYRSCQGLFSSIFSNLILGIEFLLLLLFQIYTKWDLLVAVAALALINIIMCIFILPVFFATFVQEQIVDNNSDSGSSINIIETQHLDLTVENSKPNEDTPLLKQ